MKISTLTHQLLDMNGESDFAKRVHLTQKEVGYVQQTSQSVADFFIRRLISNNRNKRGDGGFITPLVSSLERIKDLGVLPLHLNLALHAGSLQLHAFSGGELECDELLHPLWLSIMINGNGLRRMAPDTFRYATRLVGLLGVDNVETVSRHFISDPWKAYRLGLFPFALDLLDLNKSSERGAELRLRVQLATKPFDDEMVKSISDFSPTGNPLRISLISSAVAYAVKQAKPTPLKLIQELETWLREEKLSGTNAGGTPLSAQVLNAVNLVHLNQGKMDLIESNLNYLLTCVIPEISDASRRAHIEGNAHYQFSILARKRGDIEAEVNALLKAMDLDRHFSTLYYRMAQILHDQGNQQAKVFYEMALALSPFDFPVANDYGCFLMESGLNNEFGSWEILCRLLYPEQFDADVGATA